MRYVFAAHDGVVSILIDRRGICSVALPGFCLRLVRLRPFERKEDGR